MDSSNKPDDNGIKMINYLLTSIKNKPRITLVSYIDDPSCDMHKNIIPKHQESPDRTKSIRSAMNEYNLDGFMMRSGSIDLRLADIKNIHDNDYVDIIVKCGRLNKPIEIPGSTEISMKSINSLESIFAAAASVMGAVDVVCSETYIKQTSKSKKIYNYNSNRVRKIFCNVRPPGHHASRDHGAGFCFFNNVAIGAKFALTKYNTFIKKVLIIDWDLHHGDGTENIVEDDPNMVYVSFHRGGFNDDTFYPGTGNDPTYNGKYNNIFNFPFPKNTHIDDYMNKFNNDFVKIVNDVKPNIIFISAGFDSHKDDTYHELPLDYEHYNIMTQTISKLADIHCNGRLVSVLEGGYNTDVLSKSAIIHMLSLVNGYN